MTKPISSPRWALARGPAIYRSSSASNQWAGRTVLNSGSATVTVSTTVVNSDSIIRWGVQGTTRQNSGFGQSIEISSINPGNYFIFSTADGTAIPRDSIIMWEIVRTS